MNGPQHRPVAGEVGALPADFVVNHTPGIVTLTNANTTIGYCRYEASGEVEYVFVNPAWRRRGYGRLLLDMVERATGRPLRFQSPVSPLGARLLQAYLAAASKPRSG